MKIGLVKDGVEFQGQARKRDLFNFMALHCHIHGQHPKRHKNTLVPKTCNDHPVNLLTILPLKLSPPGRLLSLWLAWIGVKWNNGCCSFCLVSCVEMARLLAFFFRQNLRAAGQRPAPAISAPGRPHIPHTPSTTTCTTTSHQSSCITYTTLQHHLSHRSLLLH